MLLQRLKAAYAEDAGRRAGADGAKDRDGQFQTELFECYQRSEKALVLAALKNVTEVPTLVAACKALRNGGDARAEESTRSSGARSARRRDSGGVPVARRASQAHALANMLERVNQEIKLRLRVIRIFPNDPACVRLDLAPTN